MADREPGIECLLLPGGPAPTRAAASRWPQHLGRLIPLTFLLTSTPVLTGFGKADVKSVTPAECLHTVDVQALGGAFLHDWTTGTGDLYLGVGAQTTRWSMRGGSFAAGLSWASMSSDRRDARYSAHLELGVPLQDWEATTSERLEHDAWPSRGLYFHTTVPRVTSLAVVTGLRSELIQLAAADQGSLARVYTYAGALHAGLRWRRQKGGEVKYRYDALGLEYLEGLHTAEAYTSRSLFLGPTISGLPLRLGAIAAFRTDVLTRPGEASIGGVSAVVSEISLSYSYRSADAANGESYSQAMGGTALHYVAAQVSIGMGRGWSS